MKTTLSMSGSTLTIKVEGHITGLAQVEEIKSLVSANSRYEFIELDIVDAYVIPSALIGYLIKLVNLDKKKVTLIAHQAELKELIQELNLDKTFILRS